MAKRGTRNSAPRQQSLGDIAAGPDRVLDNVTSILANVREKKNDLVETEKLQIARALKRMMETSRASYKKNGVELLLSHTDKLRVRLVDDSEGNTEEGGEEGTDE
jgi:hypothetical protein